MDFRVVGHQQKRTAITWKNEMKEGWIRNWLKIKADLCQYSRSKELTALALN